MHHDGKAFYVNGFAMPDFGPLTMRVISPLETLIFHPLFVEQNTKSENPSQTTSERPLGEALILLGKRARGVNLMRAAKETVPLLFKLGIHALAIVKKEEQIDPFLSLSELE